MSPSESALGLFLMRTPAPLQQQQEESAGAEASERTSRFGEPLGLGFAFVLNCRELCVASTDTVFGKMSPALHLPPRGLAPQACPLAPGLQLGSRSSPAPCALGRRVARDGVSHLSRSWCPGGFLHHPSHPWAWEESHVLLRWARMGAPGRGPARLVLMKGPSVPAPADMAWL